MYAKSSRFLLTFHAFLFGTLVVGMSPIAAQTTWYVDDNAPNDPGPGSTSVSDPVEDGSTGHPFDAIREAIDVATNGDTVEILNGTYTGTGNKNLDFGGKAITVRSVSGDPSLCVINCNGTDRGFRFISGEGADSVVDGLTIKNGHAANSTPSNQYGGAVYCYESSPSITNCAIVGNTCDRYGGGIFCHDSSPTITNCTIANNVADNSYVGDGGGIYCQYHSAPTLINCTISHNSAHKYAGGVCCWDSNTILINCIITGNSAPTGGGVYCLRSTPILTNCILWSNSPTEIVVSSSSPAVTYCDVRGGWSGATNIGINPLFADADGPDNNPSTWADNDYSLSVNSPCIDAGTDSPPGGLPPGDADGKPRPIDGDQNGTSITDMGAYEYGVAPPGPWISLNTAQFEFAARKDGASPPRQSLWIHNFRDSAMDWAITDAPDWLTISPSSGQSSGELNQVLLGIDDSGVSPGLYNAVFHVTSPQAVNSPRQVAIALNLYPPGPLHVPADFPTIQAAIDVATNGEVVEIADGTYTGVGNKNLDFHGKAITVRSASGEPGFCVIDCQNEGRGFYFHSGEGADSVVQGVAIINGLTDSTTLGGHSGGGVICSYSSPSLTDCIIADCSAEGTYACGGGLYCNNDSSPTLTHCTIAGNSTYWRGGGVYCIWDSSPTLIDCSISDNSAVLDGGGLHCWSRSHPTLTDCIVSANSAYRYGGIFCADSNPTLTNCRIIGNSATGEYDGGGGLYCFGSSPTLTNCVIAGNSADGDHADGGGVNCSSNANPTLTNCTITGNSANDDGGGLYCVGCSPTLTNCTISGNSVNGDGGGICCFDSSIPTLTNCILWGDTPQETSIDAISSLAVTYCNIQGGWSGATNINADPLFFDPDGPDDNPNTHGDNDYRLTSGSPCIDAGNTGAIPADLVDLDEDDDTTELLPLDLGGQPRFIDDHQTADTGVPMLPDYPEVVDMGAYEYQPGIPGDFDHDGDVDLQDYASWLPCQAGPNQPLATGCEEMDLDQDSDVDLDDFALLQLAFQ